MLNVCYNSSLDKTVFSCILVSWFCVIVGFVCSIVCLMLEYCVGLVWIVSVGLAAGM